MYTYDICIYIHLYIYIYIVAWFCLISYCIITIMPGWITSWSIKNRIRYFEFCELSASFENCGWCSIACLDQFWMQFGAWAESRQLQERTTTETMPSVSCPLPTREPIDIPSVNLGSRTIWGASPCYSLPGPCGCSQSSVKAAWTCFNPQKWSLSRSQVTKSPQLRSPSSSPCSWNLGFFHCLWLWIINSSTGDLLCDLQGTGISRLFGRIRQRKWSAKPWWSTRRHCQSIVLTCW